MRRGVPVTMAGLAGLMLLGQAAAHAALRSSTPGDGEQVETAPAAVVLNFNEPVSAVPDGNVVFDASGERVDVGDVSVAGATVHIALRSGLANGSYVVRWAAVGSDGHPARGAFVFAVGEPVSIAPDDVAVPGPPVWPAWFAGVARGGQYLAVALAIGLVALQVFVSGIQIGLRRLTLLTAVMAIVAIGLTLMAETLRLTEGDWGDLRKGETWELAWDARHLPSALIGAVGAGLLLVWAGVAARVGVAGGGAVLLALGLAWAGHPASVDVEAAGIATNAVHVLATGAWFGGLVALLLAARGAAMEAEHVRRFSRMATIAFPLAVAAGVILVIQVLPGPETLVETDYGRLLIAKVAFVAVAGSVAFVNRTRVVRAFQRGEDQSSLLRRLVAVEIGVLAVVFGLTATLTGQSPAGSGDSEAAVSAPYVSDQFLGPYHVVVTLAPRQVGTNTLTVDFHAISEEGETAPIAATATLTRADGTGEPVSESLVNTAGSRFVGEGIAIPAAGEWTLRLEVEVSEEETGTAEFRVGIER